MGSHTVRIDLDEEENNIRNYVNVNYLVVVAAITVMFAVVISWRLTMTYFPRTTTWIWSMATSCFEFNDLDLVTRIQERGLYQNQKKKWI